jgi:hypothetical protein
MAVPEEVGHHPQVDDSPRSSAPRKGHSRHGAGKDDVVRGTPKGRAFEKRRLARPQLNRGQRRELRLRSKKTFWATALFDVWSWNSVLQPYNFYCRWSWGLRGKGQLNDTLLL